MNIRAGQLPEHIMAGSLLLMIIVGFFALNHSEWRNPARMGSSFGCATLTAVLWQISTGIQPGLSFHLLGTSALTLIAGPARAMVAFILILTANAANGHGDWLAIGVNFCILLPAILFADLWRKMSKRFFPRNFFTYFFANGFFGAAIGFWIAALINLTILCLAGVFTYNYLVDEVLPYYLLFGWAEAFSTGIVIALLIVYFPQWVETFDEEFYLNV